MWILSDPELKNTHLFHDMTRSEKLEYWFKKSRAAFKKDKNLLKPQKFGSFEWFYYQHGQIPLGLHIQMFTSIIEIMGTKE